MSIGLADDINIDLTNHVILHKQAMEKLKGHTENTSVERNRLSGLEYPLNLVMLARRALYKENTKNVGTKDQFCASDSVTNYL